MVGDRNPKYSIILPTHNRADVIGYAIESAFYQTEQDFELLIAGDGCTDDTAKVVKKYAEEKRVQWFDYPKGPGFGYANRNKVFQKARGRYIAFLAHDNILFPDHLERLGEALDKNEPADIVCSKGLYVDKTGMILPSSSNLNDQSAFDYFMSKNNTIPATCFLHRRSVFEKIGYWDDTIPAAADHDFWKRIIRSGAGRNHLVIEYPTSFHFKAIWKTEIYQVWQTGLLSLIKLINAKPGILPGSFLVNVPEGRLEQEVFWQKIIQNPSWLEQLRDDIPVFFDHLIQFELSELIEKEFRVKPSAFARIKSKLKELMPRKTKFP